MSNKKYHESRNLTDNILSPNEEIELGRILCKSTPDSKEYNDAFKKLLECNLRLVAKESFNIAKRTGLESEDLMNEGYLGLVRAIEKYNPDEFKDVRFATYALHWIKQKIYKYIYSNLIVHVPRNIVVKLIQYRRLISDKDLSREDIIKKLNITNSELSLIEKADVKQFSIFDSEDDNTEAYGEKKTSFVDLIIDDADDPSRVAVLVDRANIIKKLIDSYPNREKDIVFSYLMDDEKISLQSMAKKYKLSRERIRQIKDKVLVDMKSKLKDFES